MPIHSTSDTTSDFELFQVTYDDIPDICQIHIDAYEHDQLTQLEYRGITNEERKKAMINSIRELWPTAEPYMWGLIARRKEDGEAVGCGIYAFTDKKDLKHGGEDMLNITKALRVQPVMQDSQQSHQAQGPLTAARDKLHTWHQQGKSLQEVAHGHVMALHDKWMDNKKNRFICMCT